MSAEAEGGAFQRELEERLGGRAPAERRVLFVGILNKHLPDDEEAVLVGGGVVELYTQGAYVTADIDLVGNRAPIGALLEAAGFESRGRFYSRPDLGLDVEVPGRFLRDTETVAHVDYEGYTIPTVTLEDILIDRLLAAKFWKSSTDWEQALLLYGAHRDRIDRAALDEKAGPNEVQDLVDQLVATVEEE